MSSKRTMPLRPSEQRSSDVALAKLAVGEVDLHRVGRAERLQDDVVVLEGLGLFLGELAGLDELVHERLVARQLHELALAHEVAARVADLREEEVVVDERRGGHRRAHPAARAIELGLLEDAQARGLDGAHEAPRELVALQRRGRRRARRPSARRGCRPRAGWRSRPPPRRPSRRTPRRATPCGPTIAGAVGLEQPARLAREIGDEEVVLVVLADLPHVRPREELHADLAPGSGRSVLRVAEDGGRVGGVGLRHVSNRKSCWPIRK